jgi:membrane protein implicated in regulation of membrane protease activity
MLEFFANQGGWGWALAGIVLVGLEMFAPGMFLIWLGLAAFLTALLVGLFSLGWQASALAFAILAVASVVTGRKLSRPDRDLPDGARHLNARGQQLIGQSFRLDRPLLNGEGQLKVGDSVWRITGPDMVAGANVKVLRVDGATLVVEAG